jgi:uncharacterized protein YndB with AHSA1/START domain
MVKDRIEREVMIDAPVDVVWKVVTEPEQISAWFSDTAEIELVPGGEGMLVWYVDGVPKGGSEGAVVRLRVERLDPPRYFSFRWDYPEGAEPREGNSLLVEFSLTAEAESTRLRVVESGIAELERSEEELDKFTSEHERGWDVHLGQLREYVAGGRAASLAG